MQRRAQRQAARFEAIAVPRWSNQWPKVALTRMQEETYDTYALSDQVDAFAVVGHGFVKMRPERLRNRQNHKMLGAFHHLGKDSLKW
jgi:hypothetical protein